MFSDFDNTTFARFYDPLIGKRKYVLKKIVNGCVFILFLRMVCLPRENQHARWTRVRLRVVLFHFQEKKLFFLSTFLPKKIWKSIYLWVPFRCWRKDFWKILAVHCKTAPIFFFFLGSFSVLFCLFINNAASSRNSQPTFFSKINLNRNSWIYQRTTCPCSVKFKRKFSRSAVLFFRLGDRLRIA